MSPVASLLFIPSSNAAQTLIIKNFFLGFFFPGGKKMLEVGENAEKFMQY